MSKVTQMTIEVEEVSRHTSNCETELEIHHRIVNTNKGFISKYRLDERVFGDIEIGEKKVNVSEPVGNVDCVTKKKSLEDTLEMFEYFHDHPEESGVASWPGWEYINYSKGGPCPVCHYSGGPVKVASDACYGKCLVPIFAKEGGCQTLDGAFKTWRDDTNPERRRQLVIKIITSIREGLSVMDVEDMVGKAG